MAVPAAVDFHFSELWRTEFERGVLEPWPNRTNRDLASVVTMTLLGDTPLFGPPPAEIFDPVPRQDYLDAILRDTGTVDQYLDWDTTNVVLTLPRIWSAIATDEVHSKDTAAAWALPQLPEERRPVLERARAIYRGDAEDSWNGMLPQVRAYADYLVSKSSSQLGSEADVASSRRARPFAAATTTLSPPIRVGVAVLPYSCQARSAWARAEASRRPLMAATRRRSACGLAGSRSGSASRFAGPVAGRPPISEPTTEAGWSSNRSLRR